MADSITQYRLLDGFDDPGISPELWNDLLLDSGSSDVIFMTWHWQKAWWESFGRGKLLLIAAEREGKLLAIAPLFGDYGMIYFVGSGGSDYLDFVGLVEDEILEAMLLLAAKQVEDFSGFQFFHVPEDSPSAHSLAAVGKRQGWKLYEEGEWDCPVLELKKFPQKAEESTRKKSLLRHEAYFKRGGDLRIEHFSKADEILPHLDSFFEQHILRWKETKFPSLFLDEKQRLFYRRLSEIFSEKGWVRFTRVIWQNKTIAYHFGFVYRGNFLWYKPSFDVHLARYSPGEVLIRQLLLRALEESADTFDFGLGDEAFKSRFATGVRKVKVWGLYQHSPKNILVISPHPDDESIGCGGTIRKHVLDGDTVDVIFLTSGGRGGHGKSIKDTVHIRESESLAAAKVLGIRQVDFWREPDGEFQTTENNVARLLEKIRHFQPNIIYVPHENEEHTDHRAAANLVCHAVNLLPDTIKKPSVLMFEVWTPIQRMDHIVDISPYVEVKRQAILAYKSQCDVVRFDEAILALNRYRGELFSWPGGDYAEIFKKIK